MPVLTPNQIVDTVSQWWPGEKGRALYEIGVQAALLRADLADETGAELIGVSPDAPFTGTTLQALLDEIMAVAPPSGGTDAQFLRGDNVWANWINGPLGVGTSSLTQYNLNVSRALTGGTAVFGVSSGGTVQSDATSSAQYFYTSVGTQATSFTLASLYHYRAEQGTIGAGSSVNNQFGFFVGSTLTGGLNNYGFYSNIAAGTGRWNFYAAGTANNYFAGAVGIGSANITGYNLRVDRAITGSGSAFGIASFGAAQSDVTSSANYFYSQASTAAASFTLANLYHYRADQGTFGAGSAVTNQFGFRVESSLTGATNNYGFYGAIAAGTGRWNAYMVGTADNYFGGSIGIGSTTLTAVRVRNTLSLTGGTTMYGYSSEGVVQSDVTTSAILFGTVGQTANASFTLSNLFHYRAAQSAFGASSTVSNQYGFVAASTLIGATNNYGFYSDIASGTGRWNFYANGTAANYMAGELGIGGIAASDNTDLRVVRLITGGTVRNAVRASGVIQSDVTNTARYFSTSAATQASAFSLTVLAHFTAAQGTIGAGSTVSNQYGFHAQSTLTGATNNYGFLSEIASGTGRWNFYAAGTARNFMAGSLGLGSSTDVPSALLYMTSTTQGFCPPRMTTAQRDAISSPEPGLIIYNTSTGKLNVRGAAAWEAITSA